MLPSMRKLLFLGLILFCSCDKLLEVKEIKGPCTIVLVGGKTIVSNGNIEILESTGVMTYRDKDGKLWSLRPEEYESYTCNPV
jgi:hypothetical protein